MATTAAGDPNRLFYGDNLEVLRDNLADESVDLVYLDPPFNSNRNYNLIFAKHEKVNPGSDSAQIQAFGDTWVWTPETEQQFEALIGGGLTNQAADALLAMRNVLTENDAMSYLVNMAPRLAELHRVLKPGGSLYLHCDPTMSHYLKILLDALFGPKNFRNEIVWHYSGWNKKLKEHYERRHDVIFLYTKGDPSTFAPITTPWESKEEYLKVRKQKLHVDDEGREYVMSDRGGGQRIKRYIEEALQYGRPIDDVWNIDKLNNSSSEALGYPTQKPLALLERIITTSSKPGDVVLDPFCGCGTTIDAAEKLGRRWIGIDVTYLAIDLIVKRLQGRYSETIDGTFEVSGIPKDKAAALALFSQSPFDFERWAVSLLNAQPNQKQVGDKGVDGVARFPLGDPNLKGGGVGRILMSVKGGKSVGPQFVRDLLGTVQTQKAELGVLILMTEPTRGILDAVNHAGTYKHPGNGQTFPKVQVVTVSDLLLGRRPNLPSTVNPYMKATKAKTESSQMTFEI